MAERLLKGPFSVDDYHRMAELGILDEDDRVELLDGQVVEMSPIGPRHAATVKGLVRLLYRKLGDAVLLGVQDPIGLGPRSEPQPDIAVLKPRRDAYRHAHPRPADVLLVIEVAETSVNADRDVKLPLYARAGIPETWLVDLANEVIEVHRQPGLEGYREVHTLRRGDTLSALLLPASSVPVGEVL